MPNENATTTVRDVRFVKKLSSQITLKNYRENIKPFLEQLKKSLKDGQLLAQSQLNIKIENNNNTVFTVPKKLENSNTEALFYPSDLVRVLTGIARLFKTGDDKFKYNPEEVLSEFVGKEDDLDLVKDWGNKKIQTVNGNKITFINEQEFLKADKKSKIDKLFNAVLRATEEFEELNTPLDTEDFVNKEETQEQIIVDLIPRILEKYEAYQEKIRPGIDEESSFLDELEKKDFYNNLKRKDRFKDENLSRENISELFKEVAEKIKEKIKELIKKDKINFFQPLFNKENLKYFRKKKIYHPESEKFLVTTRQKDSLPGLLQLTTPPDDQYLVFYQEAVKRFLDNNETDLTKEFIDPLFKEEEKPQDPVEEKTAPDENLQDGDVKEITDKKLDLAKFRQRLITDLTQQILEDFKTYLEKTQKYRSVRDKLATNHLNLVKLEIHKQTKSFINSIEINDQDLKYLEEKGLFIDDQFKPEVFEDEWYLTLLNKAKEEFLKTNKTSEKEYFHKLKNQFIVPLLEELKKQAEKPTDQKPIVPDKGQTATGSRQKTTDIEKQIQYETAWLYNRIIYEKYTSQGIDLDSVDKEELSELYLKVREHLTGMDPKELRLLFGSASARQRALKNFYLKNQEIVSINKNGTPQEIKELLEDSLKENLRVDNPVLRENIQNTIDSLIIQYGINQTTYALDQNTQEVVAIKGNNPYDVIWFIDNLSQDELVSLLNLPFSDKDQLEKLKKILKNYALYRASELSLHLQQDSLQEGLVPITEEDAKKIEKGDRQTLAKYLDVTTEIRNLNKQVGGEVVAGAVDYKKERLKRYQQFIPLWNHLSGLEQAEIYKALGQEIPQEFLKNGQLDKEKLETDQLPFISDFVLFDIKKLDSIKKIEDNEELSTEEKDQLIELVTIYETIVTEVEISQVLNSGLESESPEDGSFRERAGSLEASHPENRGSRRRPSFLSKFSKKKRLKDQVKKAFKKASEKVLNKTASLALKAIPGVGLALSAAFAAIKNEKLKSFLSKVIIGGITFIIIKTLQALTTWGGLIGGVLGGFVGGFVGGIPGAAVGTVMGANIGSKIWGTRISFNSIATRPLLNNPKVSGYATGGEGVVAQAVSYQSIAVLSVGSLAFMTLIFTFIIIFIIQSAFLIPTPEVNLDLQNISGKSVLIDCDEPTPLSDLITKNNASPITQRAWDIVNKLRPGFWCYWNWNTSYDGLDDTLSNKVSGEADLFDEEEFYRYPNHCAYRDNFPEGCEGDFKAIGGSSLYWCTWLVNHAYQNNYSLRAMDMAKQFETLPGHVYLPVESITRENPVKIGDAIFTATAARSGRIGHVAIVTEVSQDSIISIDSNSSARFHSFTINEDGTVSAESVPYLKVVGFGRKL